jgi:hypothetical protein
MGRIKRRCRKAAPGLISFLVCQSGHYRQCVIDRADIFFRCSILFEGRGSTNILLRFLNHLMLGRKDRQVGYVDFGNVCIDVVLNKMSS